jgi:aromatic ring-opening dioxygenase LigB subunit
MRESHQKDKKEIIQAIENKNLSELARLRTEIIAKDDLIRKLIQIEGELKGKDEVIATLNRNID